MGFTDILGSFIGPGIGILSDIFGNREGARTTTSTPTVSGDYKTLADLLRSRAESRLRSSTDLSGLMASGISGINNAYGGAQTALNNNLTARGLATSPVAATGETNLQLGRAGSIAEFMNQLPLLQHQLQGQDMTQALQLVDQLGRGTNVVGPGSATAAGLSGLSQLIANLGKTT